MGRVLGLFLLAGGVLCCVLGGIGVAVGLSELQRDGAGILFVFGVIGAVGIVLLISAVAVLRRTKPIVGSAGPPGGSLSGTDLYPANKPVEGELDGTRYNRQYTPPTTGKRAKPSQLRFHITVESVGELELVEETEFDRMCKRIGLAVEVQTGDEKFDDGCYVRSDKPEFAAAYLSDPLKRTAILDLRRFGFMSMVLKDGLLSVVRHGFDPGAHGGSEFDADVAARLVLLARNLPADSPEFVDRSASRRLWQAVLWAVLIAFGLTALSLIGYPAVRTVDLLWRAGVVLLTWPVFAIVAAKLLSGTSRSHLAYSGVVFGSLFLYPLGAVGSVSLVNGAADSSADAVHRVTVNEKYTTKSKKTVKYHLRTGSWRPEGGTHSFEVSQQTYNTIIPNKSEVVVTTRAGALGMEWQRSYTVSIDPGK